MILPINKARILQRFTTEISLSDFSTPLKMTGIHIHPPYHHGNTGHELVVMSSPKMLTPDEYGRFNLYLQNTVMKNVY